MKQHIPKWPFCLVINLAFFVVNMSPKVWADDNKIPYSEVQLFFELNNTDGELDIHALIDGDAWKNLPSKIPMGKTSYG